MIVVVGFDALPIALKAIDAGEMEATIRQDPARMGSEGVDLAVKIVQGEDVEDFIPIPGLVITKENVADYLSD